MKGIEDINIKKVNHKISDHKILLGKSKGPIKFNESFTSIEINDKEIIEKNDEASVHPNLENFVILIQKNN